jgi:ABC-type proline/glycine betaine transport system ATPase subunit
LDEPSTGMDPYTRISLMDILNKAYLKSIDDEDKSQRSMVLTTHSIEEAEVLCDEICILNKGEISPNGKGKISELLQRESEGIILNVEFTKPSQREIKNKYGDILSEKINSIKELKQFLYYLKKEKYYEYIKPDGLGKDLLNLLNKKPTNKFTILRWVEYMDYLSGLIDKIGKYFGNVTCKKYKLNNCILKISNNDFENKKGLKCESHIFGIIEGNKKELFINEYNYSLTTLENIFIKCSDNNNKINGKDSLEETESGIQL